MERKPMEQILTSSVAMHWPAVGGLRDLEHAMQHLSFQIQSQARLTAFVETDGLIELLTGRRMEDHRDQWYFSLS